MNIVQVTVMDEKGYILEYKDLNPKDKEGLVAYILKHMTNISATKIHIRKW